MQILQATFFGYAAFYLVRNNFSVVAKDMKAVMAYSDVQLGNILAVTAITYGLGKFVMGALSDRSNPRIFMACGLLLTAACNFAFGAILSYPMHLFLWGLNGLAQGMGWPPCGRSMGHWFSQKERGLTFSIWNTSHNLGGGLAGVVAAYGAVHFGGWQYAFYVPGILAVLGAIHVFIFLRDTPQSVGLPPIEDYAASLSSGGRCSSCEYDLTGNTSGVCPECGTRTSAEPASTQTADDERELSLRELLFDYVLTNKIIWLLAIANFFAYITRYSMLDWGPLYLREIKGASLQSGGWAVFALEFGGIPSTILLGWISDKLGGRRGMVATLCLLPIILAFAAIRFTPPGYLWFDMTMLVIVGLFIYPVINFVVIIALDLTSKKAIGTAAGFIGLIGYMGRTAQAKGFGAMLVHYEAIYGRAAAWNVVLGTILVCTGIAAGLLAFTWRLHPGSMQPPRRRQRASTIQHGKAQPPPLTAAGSRT
jgi:OPA family glycerol-3-phosphate transporter-like MFS transporter